MTNMHNVLSVSCVVSENASQLILKMLLLTKYSTYNTQNINCHVRYFTIHVTITQENSFVYSVGTGNGL